MGQSGHSRERKALLICMVNEGKTVMPGLYDGKTPNSLAFVRRSI
jgi:hypothetical protein